MLAFPAGKCPVEEREQNFVRAKSAHPCVSLVDFPVFTTDYPMTVGELYSSSDPAANHTEEYAELAVRDLRRETDELSDGGETTESSHRWTDDMESEVPEEWEALSDVEETPFAPGR